MHFELHVFSAYIQAFVVEPDKRKYWMHSFYFTSGANEVVQHSFTRCFRFLEKVLRIKKKNMLTLIRIHLFYPMSDPTLQDVNHVQNKTGIAAVWYCNDAYKALSYSELRIIPSHYVSTKSKKWTIMIFYSHCSRPHGPTAKYAF